MEVRFPPPVNKSHGFYINYNSFYSGFYSGSYSSYAVSTDAAQSYTEEATKDWQGLSKKRLVELYT